MATIRDIAEKAMVSPATVSRILNHDVSLSVGDATKLRVLAAAEELEYTSLKQRRRGAKAAKRVTIAIVEWYGDSALVEDPYYLYLMTTVEKLLAKEGIDNFKFLSIDGEYVPAVGAPIDGIIAIGRFTPAQVRKLTSFCGRIVFIDSSPDEGRYDSVLANASLGTRLALDYLFSLGHRSIAYVGGEVIDDLGEKGEDARKLTFAKYMKRRDALDASLFFEGRRLSFEDGFELAGRLAGLKRRPTAVFCANDTMATGALAKFKELGLAVPGDMSLVGFNDLPSVKYLDPPLTSVKVPMPYLAATAVEILKARISDSASLPLKVLVPTSLAIRASTAAPSTAR